MPATKIPVLTLTVVLAATIGENIAVTKAGALPGAGVRIFGVTDYGGDANDSVAVDTMGTTIGTAGAAISEDDDLEVTAAGKFITKTTGIVVAKAMQAAGADGDKLEVFLLPK